MSETTQSGPGFLNRLKIVGVAYLNVARVAWAHTALLILLLIVGPLFAISNWPYTERELRADDWQKRPDAIWTRVESTELNRQAQHGELGLSVALYGPGPIAPDLSESAVERIGVSRLRLNAVADAMQTDYERQLLRGGPFDATSNESSSRVDGLATGTGRQANRNFDPAFMRALRDFRSGNLLSARNSLAGAGCNQQVADNPTDNNQAAAAAAPTASIRILCNWLSGRLEAQAAGRSVPPAAVERLRLAIDEAKRNGPTDRQARGSAEPRFVAIPQLQPDQYLMNLTEAAGAALWQDYLAALALSGNRLCQEPCHEELANATLTDDGKFFKALVDGSKPEMWQAYPEMAVLTRFLLAREGWIAAARRIHWPAKDEEAPAGYQIYRDNVRVTLHPRFEPLNHALVFAIELNPSVGEGELSDGARFWHAHAAARRVLLGGTGADSFNPFGTGNAGDQVYRAFDKVWRQQVRDSKSLTSIGLYWVAILAFGLAIAWLILVAKGPVRKLRDMHLRDYNDVMGSWYFAQPAGGAAQ